MLIPGSKTVPTILLIFDKKRNSSLKNSYPLLLKYSHDTFLSLYRTESIKKGSHMNYLDFFTKTINFGLLLLLQSAFLRGGIGFHEQKNADMVIFVHGTMAPAEFSFSSLFKIMQDKLDNTLYSKAVGHMRNDAFLFQGQVMQELGLHKISLSPETPHTTARTVAFMYNTQFEALGIKTAKHLYYTFGWDGLLSASKRFEAAKIFYRELSRELEALAADGIFPRIHIYSFSHGGNVALYLPQIRDSFIFTPTVTFTIDSLILLGTPIQSETDHLVMDDIFTKIYHFYSLEDSVQTWDIFSSSHLFPRRMFISRTEFKVPDKVRQVRLRLTKDIKRKKHLKGIYTYPHEILENKTIGLIHKDPGHTELWSFKWGSPWYRDSFPLNPLPLMSLLPTILHAVDQVEHAKSLIFDFSPKENGILLVDKKSGLRKAMPFLTPIIQEELWEIAKKYRPLDFTFEAQRERVALALQKASNELLRIRKYRKPHSRALASYMKKLNLGEFDTVPEIKKIRKSHLLCAQW